MSEFAGKQHWWKLLLKNVENALLVIPLSLDVHDARFQDASFVERDESPQEVRFWYKDEKIAVPNF